MCPEVLESTFNCSWDFEQHVLTCSPNCSPWTYTGSDRRVIQFPMSRHFSSIRALYITMNWNLEGVAFISFTVNRSIPLLQSVRGFVIYDLSPEMDTWLSYLRRNYKLYSCQGTGIGQIVRTLKKKGPNVALGEHPWSIIPISYGD